MQLFRNRPFALSCIVFAGMAFLCYFLNASLCLLTALLLFVAFAVFTVLYVVLKKRTLFLIGLCLGMSIVAALSMGLLFHARCQTYETSVGEEVEIRGTVLSVRSFHYEGEELEVSLWSLDGTACYDSVRLKCSFDTNLEIGDNFRALVTCEDFASSESYDARAAALSDGIFGMMSLDKAENLARLENGRFSVRGSMLALRAALSERLSQRIGGEEGALCVAFLLGDKSLLSDDSVLHFRRVGISHLLALSGLHVSIMIAFLEFVLRRFGCPRTVRAIAVIFFSFAYLLLTGCALSTVRAVLMCGALMLAFLFKESYDSFTALCVALVLILTFTPWAIADLGMWMSFLAAGSIVVFQPILPLLKERFLKGSTRGGIAARLLPGVLGMIFVGMTANLALAPIQGFVFGELPLLSIPATLLLSYPLTAVLILSVLCLVFSPTAFLCRAVSALILWCAETFSAFEGIVLPLGDVYSDCLLLLLALSLVAIAVFRIERMLLGILIPTVLGLCLIPCSMIVTRAHFDSVTAEYICADSGDGEALLISREGRCVVVDLSSDSSSAVYALSDKAKEARCTEIGDLILTCYAKGDVDMLSRLSSDLLVRRLRLPKPQNEWERGLAQEIYREARLHGIEVFFDTEDAELAEIREIRIFEFRERENERPPILFSFSCGGTCLTYANAAFAESNLYGHLYVDLLADTEVMIHGGARRKDNVFYANFADLHTLILKSEEHRASFSRKLLASGVERTERKYVFE